MALDTTPGGAAADSYATLVEANTYFTDKRVPLAWWATATDAQKEAALRMAAILLDRLFDWTGSVVTETQARMWPRNAMLARNGFPLPTSGATSIPVDLKDAQAEFAGQLGTSDRLLDNDALRQGITSVKAGSVAVTFAEVDQSSEDAVEMGLRRQTFDFQWASRTVPDGVRQMLVESWYTAHLIKNPLMFGAL